MLYYSKGFKKKEERRPASLSIYVNHDILKT